MAFEAHHTLPAELQAAAAALIETQQTEAKSSPYDVSADSLRQDAYGVGRAASVLAGGVADGVIDGAKHSLNINTVETIATTYGVSYGLGALARSGPVGQKIAMAGGMAMGASMVYNEYMGGRPQATLRAVGDAFGSDKNLAEDRKTIAATGGALAFDFALAGAAGGLGFKHGLKLDQALPVAALSKIKGGYSGAVDFLSRDGRESTFYPNDNRLGLGFASRDDLSSKAIGPAIDTSKITPTTPYNDSLRQLARDTDGQLFARGRAGSDGVYAPIELNQNAIVKPGHKVYVGARDVTDLVNLMGQNTSRGQESYKVGAIDVGKDHADNTYVRDSGKGPAGVFMQKAMVGNMLKVAPEDKFVHFGPHGILALDQSAKIELPIKAAVAPVIPRPTLKSIDVTSLQPGETVDANKFVSIFRDSKGELHARARSRSEGIFLPVEANRLVPLDGTPIYIANLRYEQTLKDAADQLSPGTAGYFSQHRIIQKNANGETFVRDDGKSAAGTFVQAAAVGRFVHLERGKGNIHLGPHGQMQIIDYQPPIKPVVAPIARPAAPAASAFDANTAQRSLQDLRDLIHGGRHVQDAAWRDGKFASAVLLPAKGGIERAGGWVQPLYDKEDLARGAARFMAEIFRRRLADDPKDTSTAPKTVPNVQKINTLSGNYYAATASIAGFGSGHVVLDSALQPAGMLDATGKAIRVEKW